MSNIFDKPEAEYLGFILSNGKIGYSSEGTNLIFSSGEFSIIRKIVKLANKLKIEREEDILQKENNRIILKFNRINSIPTLRTIKENIKKFTADEGKAFLRGVFLGCGILSTPPSYHIELRFEKKEDMEIVKKIINDFKIKHSPKNNIIYITGRENVKSFLYHIGAIDTYLYMEEDAINKKVTNEANRKANFEFANLKRQSNASTKQINILKRIEEEGLMDNLSDELKEIALLRLQYPYSSLRELSEKINGRLSKQTIYYRLKKILKIYDEK